MSEISFLLGRKEKRGLQSWFCSDWLSAGRRKWAANECWPTGRSCKRLHPNARHPPVWPKILWPVDRTGRQGSAQWNGWIHPCPKNSRLIKTGSSGLLSNRKTNLQFTPAIQNVLLVGIGTFGFEAERISTQVNAFLVKIFNKRLIHCNKSINNSLFHHILKGQNLFTTRQIFHRGEGEIGSDISKRVDGVHSLGEFQTFQGDTETIAPLLQGVRQLNLKRYIT